MNKGFTLNQNKSQQNDVRYLYQSYYYAGFHRDFFKKNRYGSGFTIIEILIVLFILSFLSGISYFGFTTIKNSLDVNYASKQVFSDMRLTQEMAKTAHYPHQITFYRGGNEYQITNLENDSMVKKEKISGTVRFDGKELFIFSASGNPVVGGSGTLKLTNMNNKTRKIIVAPNGRIRIE